MRRLHAMCFFSCSSLWPTVALGFEALRVEATLPRDSSTNVGVGSQQRHELLGGHGGKDALCERFINQGCDHSSQLYLVIHHQLSQTQK